MNNEIVIPIHRAIDKEAVLGCMKSLGIKGLDFEKAEELGVISRISNLLCAMHALSTVECDIMAEAEHLFDVCRMNKHELKKACSDFHKAYDRWFSFWRKYQTVDGVLEMNKESADLREQYMRWLQIPVHWELGQPQEIHSEKEPLIEIDGGEKIWRIYRDVGDSEIVGDIEEEWAVMRSKQKAFEGSKEMICVERGLDKSSAQMCAKRMSSNDHDMLYTASRLDSLTEKRVEVVPFKAYFNGELIGDIKSVIKKEK